MKRILLDGNIYDKLAADQQCRKLLAAHIAAGRVDVVATLVVVDELQESPFGGLPDWFPVTTEPESAFVLGHARLGMARLGSGDVFTAHRGDSGQTKDAIMADSAHALGDVFVSEDRRCRTRLASISTICDALNYEQFRAWLGNLPNE